LRPDYYRILAVEPDADDLTLKCAYYKLAAQYHPDRNQSGPEAEQKFRDVAAAYEVLSDPGRRATYDAGSGVALQKQVEVSVPKQSVSQLPVRRIVPYTIAVVTALILSVSLSGLGRFLASNTGHGAAQQAPPVVEAVPPTPEPRSVAPPRSAPGKRVAAQSVGRVTIVRGAKPVTQTELTYSPDALQERISGLVELQLTIAADGSVQSPQILSGHPLLTKDIAETVSHWTFQSMRVNGRPMPRTTEMTIRFDIVK